MTSGLTVVAYLLRSLASVALLLLLGGLIQPARKRLPALRGLAARRVSLLLAAVLAWGGGGGAMAWRDRLEGVASLALSQGPEGQLAQKATGLGLELELRRAGTEAGGPAQAAFRLAEMGLATGRYAEAAADYARSAQVIPTLAAHLNRGLSLLYLEDFAGAEEAFRAGLRIAREARASRQEAACLDGVGWAALGQGRVAEALAAHQAALALHTEAGNPVGRAIAHAGVADAYLRQGRLEEGLAAEREAFVLYTRLGNLLGRASAIGRIADAYRRLGRLGEASSAFQQALAVDREIANPLGEASDLQGIADVHLARGERQAALEALLQARAVYRRHGIASRGAHALERRIGRLRAEAAGAG